MLDEEAERAYWKILNRMTPAEKLTAFHRLYWTARKLKAAGLQMEFPNMSDDEIEKKVKEAFLYAYD
jgi:hypothetical protein